MELEDRPFAVSVKVPTDQPDGDYTQEFLDAGTTFTPSIPGMSFKGPVPVEKGWVKDGVLHLEGKAQFGPGPAKPVDAEADK